MLITKVTAGIAVGVIGAAGVLKLLDAQSFFDSLQSWELLPKAVLPLIAIVIPAAEVLVAGWWFATGSRRALFVAMALLVMFTAAFGAHWIVAQPPECECFGRIMSFEQSREGAAFAMARNGVLLGMMSVGLMVRRNG